MGDVRLSEKSKFPSLLGWKMGMFGAQKKIGFAVRGEN